MPIVAWIQTVTFHLLIWQIICNVAVIYNYRLCLSHVAELTKDLTRLEQHRLI